MTCKNTWKLSTCLAAGATALAFVMSASPSLAGGGRGGAERPFGRTSATQLQSAMFGPSAQFKVVAMPASSASISRPTPAETTTKVVDPLVPRDSFADPGIAQSASAPITRKVEDPLVPRDSFGSPDGVAASASSGTRKVVDPLLPRDSFGKPDGVAASASSGTRKVVDPLVPRDSFRGLQSSVTEASGRTGSD